MSEEEYMLNVRYDLYNAAATLHADVLALVKEYNERREYYKNRRTWNDGHYALLVLYTEEKDRKTTNHIGLRIRWRITRYVNSHNKRLPRSKKLKMGKNCEYSLNSVNLIGVMDWEIELFNEYEPMMAEYRRKFKKIGVMFRLSREYVKLYLS